MHRVGGLSASQLSAAGPQWLLSVCACLRGVKHIYVYTYLCVCVLVSVWKAFISTAFDAHSLFLSFVKQGRRGNIVVLFYPKPLESTAS